MKEIRINADPLIEAQIAFDFDNKTISFSGEGISQLSSHKLVKLNITLVNTFCEVTYS